MAWKDVTVEEQRHELVMLAQQSGVNISRLAQRFGISRKTAYKWLKRFAEGGDLASQSRRPRHSPFKTSEEVERKIIALRKEHSAWGARKLKQRLEDVGCSSLPAVSTITEILRRNELLYQPEIIPSIPWQRFARVQPNELWQMDFKGHVPCVGGRCHPLTALDDCTRYAVILKACVDERLGTVQAALTEAFRRFGLPWQMLMDNGSPWGTSRHPTRLTIWLMRLGIVVCHGRAYHPQTQGKEERFHRTLKAEVVGEGMPWNYDQCQREFDRWRDIYNTQRPHEALQMKTPASLYAVGTRSFPEQLPEITYGPDDEVRKVQAEGWVLFKGRELRIGKGLVKQPVAFRADPDTQDQWNIYFCQQRIGSINLTNIPKGTKTCVTDVPEHL